MQWHETAKWGINAFMPGPNRYFIGSTVAFLFVGFVALMSIVAMNFWLEMRAHVYSNAAIATRDMRVAAVNLRNAMQTAESSQRGFIVTGDASYLAPLQTAKTQAERNLSALRKLLQHDAEGQAMLVQLDQILTRKFAELDQTIALKRAGHNDEMLTIFRSDLDKTLTDEANVFFAGLIIKADARLTAGVDEQRNNTRLLRLVSAIAALIIVTVVGGAAFAITRYTSELRKSRDQINAFNSELEARVADRVAELAQARDRAEVLLSEVNHRVANSLSLVSSLVNLQAKALLDPAAKEALSETRDRILAVALVHQRLYVSGDPRSVSLDEYLKGLLDQLSASMQSQGSGVTITYALEPVTMETDTSISLGVVVAELVTNAFKYAYPEGAGEIRVSLCELPDGQAKLIVEDDGVGQTASLAAQGTGLGTKIIQAMCVSIDAELSYGEREPGTEAKLIFSPKREAVQQDASEV